MNCKLECEWLWEWFFSSWIFITFNYELLEVKLPTCVSNVEAGWLEHVQFGMADYHFRFHPQVFDFRHFSRWGAIIPASSELVWLGLKYTRRAMVFKLRNVVIVCSIITARIRLMLAGQVRNNHDKSWLLFAPLVGTPAGQVVSHAGPTGQNIHRLTH